MFSHADRIPTTPSVPRADGDSISQPPWGISRMAPFPNIIVLPEMSVIFDPETQTAQYVTLDGQAIVMDGHRKSNTGTETKTRTGGGDGANPTSSDEDNSQDSDQD